MRENPLGVHNSTLPLGGSLTGSFSRSHLFIDPNSCSAAQSHPQMLTDSADAIKSSDTPHLDNYTTTAVFAPNLHQHYTPTSREAAHANLSQGCAFTRLSC